MADQNQPGPPEVLGAEKLSTRSRKVAMDAFLQEIKDVANAKLIGAGGKVPIAVPPMPLTANNIGFIQLRFGRNGSGTVLFLPYRLQEVPALQRLIAVLTAGSPASPQLPATAFTASFSPYEAGMTHAIAQLLFPRIIADRSQQGIRPLLRGFEVFTPRVGHLVAWRLSCRNLGHCTWGGLWLLFRQAESISAHHSLVLVEPCFSLGQVATFACSTQKKSKCTGCNTSGAKMCPCRRAKTLFNPAKA